MIERQIAGLPTRYFPAENHQGNPKDRSGKLLVVLHGLGDSSAGYLWVQKELAMPDCSYLLVDAPDAHFDGYSWFDLYQNPGPGVIRSRKLLCDLLTALEGDGWKSQQIGLFGFSQGALMSIETAVIYPRLLWAVVAVCGFVFSLDDMPESFSPVAKEQNFLLTHGIQDPVVPIELTRPQVKRMRELGLRIGWREYPKVHTIDPGQELDDIRAFLKNPRGPSGP